ncbi:Nitroreductase family protein [Streptoalloteichus tenebrarius]|uniref:Nitroreductase family protein n=1 Tax=Streptoalloteichus tenebrarius (strain ATCC 17920 / DSM 40477 / JCM 4838 / CBS 697.72 / NBRC 16177 / NCIMB 11028 / NRRL B-12390 / A12253. 1 / ISP 5477) TaxID=1933 RepID=A0ABT1I0A9_STRSD|nr:nitroreductase family protein [Streptoalloteichus tenebrarius]MCP2261232.1 Nitroreductase family protein [Streptoalloteichus tenebrarius]BFF04424.1 nitroreductase family protein [Streptoalloteichus tenebrarius]
MNAVPEALGLRPDQVEAVLAAAGAAPSVHNTQPWRFRVTSEGIELHADPTRRLPVVDPEERELHLSCGAALFNLRVALESFGVRPLVSVVPDPARPELVAVVRRGGLARPDQQRDALVRAVPLRRTNRLPFRDEPVPAGHRQALVRAAQAERAWLHVVEDRTERARLRTMAARGHETLWADPAYRAELTRWTGGESGRTDGVPASAGGPRAEPQDEWVLRDFTGGHARPRAAGKDFEADPLLVVLCTFYEGRLAEVQAGQAMERVLLTATSLGLSASFLSQVVEVRPVREELRRLLGGGLEPQMLLRIGFGSPVPAVPRRPVADLLVQDSKVG